MGYEPKKCDPKKDKNDKKCKAVKWKGDGNCDDANNNCGCQWDGGDCCQTKDDKEGAKFKFCTKCLCLDEKQAPKCQKNGSCGNRKFANDGRCDDANNNCGCNWDGGDCCRENGDKFRKAYCKVCKCLNPQLQIKCKGYCKKPNWQGDGNCDDDNNNCGCKYDGGDCCGESTSDHQFDYCIKCTCLDPESKNKGKKNNK